LSTVVSVLVYGAHTPTFRFYLTGLGGNLQPTQPMASEYCAVNKNHVHSVY